MESKHELEKVSWGVIPITVYRGCLVTKLVGGWEIWGKRVLTTTDVDELIDKAGSIISESIPVYRGGIKVVNTGSISSLSGEINPENDSDKEIYLKGTSTKI